MSIYRFYYDLTFLLKFIDIYINKKTTNFPMHFTQQSLYIERVYVVCCLVSLAEVVVQSEVVAI